MKGTGSHFTLSTNHSSTQHTTSTPAYQERISLCPSCDWQTHSSTSAVSTHKRQAVSCYSGCPSAAELSTMWSFLLDFQSVGDSTCEKGMGSISIADNRSKDIPKAEGDNNIQDDSVNNEADELQKMDKSTSWMGSSGPLNVEQATEPASTASAKSFHTIKIVASPCFMGEPPWCPPGPESSLPVPSNRNDAVLRYKEKKKTRNFLVALYRFDKSARYAKARLHQKAARKGRFIKAGDVYDYDPMNETRSC
ncbi:hypothetical protein Leryth_016764 [Lithospermum erythrorhizon]|nr:hypothetical protein Leryth_016764 [Lithospermum erythrorhizon]